MITFYTGTPGSGKSFHLAQRCFYILRHQKTNIIANFEINLENVALTRLGWMKYCITEMTKGKVKFRHYNKKKLRGYFEYT